MTLILSNSKKETCIHINSPPNVNKPTIKVVRSKQQNTNAQYHSLFEGYDKCIATENIHMLIMTKHADKFSEPLQTIT